jgi:hypothetical protein
VLYRNVRRAALTFVLMAVCLSAACGGKTTDGVRTCPSEQPSNEPLENCTIYCRLGCNCANEEAACEAACGQALSQGRLQPACLSCAIEYASEVPVSPYCEQTVSSDNDGGQLFVITYPPSQCDNPCDSSAIGDQ